MQPFPMAPMPVYLCRYTKFPTQLTKTLPVASRSTDYHHHNIARTSILHITVDMSEIVLRSSNYASSRERPATAWALPCFHRARFTCQKSCFLL